MSIVVFFLPVSLALQLVRTLFFSLHRKIRSYMLVVYYVYENLCVCMYLIRTLNFYFLNILSHDGATQIYRNISNPCLPFLNLMMIISRDQKKGKKIPESIDYISNHPTTPKQEYITHHHHAIICQWVVRLEFEKFSSKIRVRKYFPIDGKILVVGEKSPMYT